jgi:hypothetical protein
MSGETPKAKRSFEDLATSPENNQLQVSKTPKMDPKGQKKPATLEEILEAIRELTTTVNDTKRDMEEVKNSVYNLHTTIESINATLSDRINANEKQIQMITNTTKRDLDRVEIAKEIVISGIPESKDEKLTTAFQSICRVLGYDDSLPSVRIRRFRPKENATEENQLTDTRTGTKSHPVFVEFAFAMDKRLFLYRYFKKKDLNLTALGFSNTKRIYVNERLTRDDFECKKAALKLKSDGKLYSVSTRYAKVFVKLRKDSDDQQITDVSQLQHLN